jgi:pseudouridine-5'-phosphate glycosidase
VLGLETDEFPAFYRRSSGLPVDRRVDSIAELAASVSAHFQLGLGTGLLVANPVPAADEMRPDLYDRALETALAAVQREGVRGRAVTPFLLARLSELTGGESIRTNLALLRHNARVAGRLARELASLSGHDRQPVGQ